MAKATRSSAPSKSLPARPNLNYLKKLAKERLRSLREALPKAKLAAAQLAVAREYGFPSWRSLHAHVQSLVKDNATPSQLKALLDAILKRDAATAERMLRETPSLANSKTEEGWTPLHSAAEHNQPRIIEMLVAAGANLEAMMGQYKHNALSWAVTCRAFNAARTLTRLGMKPDLFSAAGMGDVAAIKAFFDDKGQLLPNASKTGSSRYDEKGSLLPSPPTEPAEIVADALYIATRAGHVDAVRLLLEHQPRLDIRAYMGATPLHWAYFSGSQAVVQLLLNAGADPTPRDATFKCRPRAFGICAASSWGILPLVRALLKDDPTLAKISDEPTSPLHEAASAGHLEIVAALLLAGADLNAQNAEGKTPHQLAIEKSHTQLAAVLAMRPVEANTAAAGRAVKAMERAWAESHAIIEKRFTDLEEGPRWESTGAVSPTLLERQADEAIRARGQLGQFRMLSIWHIIKVPQTGRAIDIGMAPTRVLEYFRDGDHGIEPTGGSWRRVHWQPSRLGFAGKPGRWDDLAEAITFLSTSAQPGEYRVVTVRRMLRAQQSKGGIKVIKKHADIRSLALPEKDESNRPEPQCAKLPEHRKGHKIAQWQPIMDAAFAGNVNRTRELLDAGADPNVISTTPHRYRPLHRAIEHKKTLPKHEGHDAVVRLLLERGADPKQRATQTRLTALQLAGAHEPRFIPLLINYFQPFDIFHAAVVADVTRVRSLLAADPSAAKAHDSNGRTPLHYCAASAMFHNDARHSAALVEIAKMLLKANADPNATYLYNNEWPIPVLFQCCGHQNNPAVAKVLLDAGADPCDNESVYHASDEGHMECLALFEQYVDPKKLADECTKCLNTQLHWGHTRGMKWLLEHGADPNWKHPTRKLTAIDEAVRKGRNRKVIELLKEYSAKRRPARSAIPGGRRGRV